MHGTTANSIIPNAKHTSSYLKRMDLNYVSIISMFKKKHSSNHKLFTLFSVNEAI